MTIRPEIDPVAAEGLHRTGLSWRQVGILLAKQIGRPVPFQVRSLQNAVRKAERS